MYPSEHQIHFISALSSYLEAHLAEKRAFGCRYISRAYCLRSFDRYLVEQNVTRPDFSRELLEKWLAKRPNESAATQAERHTAVRQFCLFLERQGITPYIPTGHVLARRRHNFTPYIYSPEEIRALFAVLCEVTPHPRSPLRDKIVPLVFRLLYGCGLRISEVLHLRIEDVDIGGGLLAIRETKFLKDRLVPMAPLLTGHMQSYAVSLPTQVPKESWFFPAPDGGQWCQKVFSDRLHWALRKCSIPYLGQHLGPRLHDFRHTFACHRLAKWLREGVDIDLALPILSTYLGHESIYRTQRYLHLFPHLYPDITDKLTAYCGTVIPNEEVIL